MTQEVVCFDVETTGLNKVDDRILQLSIIKFDSRTFDTLIERNWYIKPTGNYRIDSVAQEIHGISKEFIEENGIPLRAIADEIVEIFGEWDVLTYNGNAFDVEFLERELNRVGKTIKWGARKCYDAMVLESKLISKRLGATYRRYTGQEMEDAHNSLCDVKATIDVFKCQLGLDHEAVKNLNDDEDYVMLTAERIIAMRNGLESFTRGKHAHRSVLEVCNEDPGYIKWLFNNCTPEARVAIRDAYLRQKVNV